MIATPTPVPTKKPRINVTFEDDLYEKIQQWADSEDRSMSNLIYKIVKQAVEAREKAEGEGGGKG